MTATDLRAVDLTVAGAPALVPRPLRARLRRDVRGSRPVLGSTFARALPATVMFAATAALVAAGALPVADGEADEGADVLLVVGHQDARGSTDGEGAGAREEGVQGLVHGSSHRSGGSGDGAMGLVTRDNGPPSEGLQRAAGRLTP